MGAPTVLGQSGGFWRLPLDGKVPVQIHHLAVAAVVPHVDIVQLVFDTRGIYARHNDRVEFWRECSLLHVVDEAFYHLPPGMFVAVEAAQHEGATLRRPGCREEMRDHWNIRLRGRSIGLGHWRDGFGFIRGRRELRGIVRGESQLTNGRCEMVLDEQCGHGARRLPDFDRGIGHGVGVLRNPWKVERGPRDRRRWPLHDVRGRTALRHRGGGSFGLQFRWIGRGADGSARMLYRGSAAALLHYVC